jgi:hypothetical protein
MDPSIEPSSAKASKSSAQASGQGRAEPETRYGVGGVAHKAAAHGDAPEVESAVRPRRVAVFVAHGMGQQIPFQTLDQVAEGLLEQDQKKAAVKPQVRAVKFQDQWLHRIELGLRSGTKDAVEAHVYEGYWAPLTEGKITARGVMSFLRDGGINGIQNGSREFYRWLFGEYRAFGSPIRIVFYLLIALATVAALVVMNTTIALVAAGRALLAKEPAWLTDGLFLDLTTTFNAVVTAMVVFGLALALSYGLRKLGTPAWVRLAWGWLTVLLFASVLFVITLGGLSLVLLVYGHVKWTTDKTDQLWHRIFYPSLLNGFNRGFDTAALVLALVTGALFLAWWLYRFVRGVIRDLETPRGRWLTLFATVCLAVLGVLAVLLGLAFLKIFRQTAGSNAGAILRSGLAWPLLAALSFFIRQVLVQYVGDVAIYFEPYKLDSFVKLRNEIKDCVQKTASAVYSLQRDDGSPQYDAVLVVGHSLGSVIVYDVLNRLINEDEAAGGRLNVVGRTPLLLTFGSPLDKKAFLFAVQRKNTKEAREALAATDQPLIRGYGFRPKRWINIYSPWDIISGHLSFYDPLKSADPKRVENLIDPGATTLLAAHVEYWTSKDKLLFKLLYAALAADPEAALDTVTEESRRAVRSRCRQRAPDSRDAAGPMASRNTPQSP